MLGWRTEARSLISFSALAFSLSPIALNFTRFRAYSWLSLILLTLYTELNAPSPFKPTELANNVKILHHLSIEITEI
jgi:hypothetical protein